jgi:hypothetical protein
VSCDLAGSFRLSSAGLGYLAARSASTERQAHEVKDGERLRRLSRHRQEKIRLNHRNRGRETDEKRGLESGLRTTFATVEPDEGAGDHCEDEAEGDVLPGKTPSFRAEAGSL